MDWKENSMHPLQTDFLRRELAEIDSTPISSDRCPCVPCLLHAQPNRARPASHGCEYSWPPPPPASRPRTPRCLLALLPRFHHSTCESSARGFHIYPSPCGRSRQSYPSEARLHRNQ